jgi:polysaccharide biosynthesis/export protein
MRNFIFVLFLGFAACLQSSAVDTVAQEEQQKPLEVGDQLEYFILEEGQDEQMIFVDEQGKVNVPLIGSIDAKGLSLEELAGKIKALLEEKYYKQATVVLNKHFSQDSGRGKVFILGQVVNQGPVIIPNNELLTLTKAILSAGGFTPIADLSTVSVTRNDPDKPEEKIRTVINMHEVLDQGNLSKDIILQANDVVLVSEKGDLNGKVFVVGEVRSPGYYTIPPGKELTLSQAILAAGGFTEFSNQAKVKLVKADPKLSEKERTLFINAKKIFKKGDRSQDYTLSNNDMIIVDESWINF